MEIIDYPNYNERLFVSKLSNGLTVYMQPKKGFNKTTAVLGVNYGSIDSQFILNGQKVVQPAGIAHFLEHKMFDKKITTSLNCLTKPEPARMPLPALPRPTTCFQRQNRSKKIWTSC